MAFKELAKILMAFKEFTPQCMVWLFFSGMSQQIIYAPIHHLCDLVVSKERRRKPAYIRVCLRLPLLSLRLEGLSSIPDQFSHALYIDE